MPQRFGAKVRGARVQFVTLSVRRRVARTARFVRSSLHFEEISCGYRVSDRPIVKRDVKYHEQIRDAAAGGPRTIAEGFARRTHPDFARFLDIARASLTECQNHLLDGVDRRYLEQDECDRLVVLAKRACGAVAALQRYLRGDA